MTLQDFIHIRVTVGRTVRQALRVVIVCAFVCALLVPWAPAITTLSVQPTVRPTVNLYMLLPTAGHTDITVLQGHGSRGYTTSRCMY